MATQDQIDELRRAIDEPDNVAPYDDQALAAIIDLKGSVDSAAARIWTDKAASVASLVNISEGGSSRANSQIHTNYLHMAERYAAGAAAGQPVGRKRAGTREITRG